MAGLRQDPGPPGVHWSATGPGSYGFGANAAYGEPIFFQTQLEGVDPDWTAPSRESKREFAGLGPGSYVFHVRAVDAFGRPGAAITSTFFLPSPWYLKKPAILGFAALALLALVTVVRLRTRQMFRRNERLERLIEERTRELAMSNRDKTDFLSNISHEIRNPLNGIVGLVAMLRESAAGDQERELARSIAACARTLSKVFDEVLNFSKLENGQVPLRKREFAVDRLLDEVVRVFESTAAQRGNRLVLSIAEGTDRPLRGDDEKIKTIVSNFVSNALKYAPGTPVEIEASLEVGTKGNATLHVQVTDHGRGVPRQEQELVFRKFVRGTSADIEREPGAGLGLATCKAFAELMNGGVGIESPARESNEGATFYLHVPVEQGVKSAEEAPPHLEGLESPAWVGSETGRALIVEDQEYNQIVLRRVTGAAGFCAGRGGGRKGRARSVRGGYLCRSLRGLGITGNHEGNRLGAAVAPTPERQQRDRAGSHGTRQRRHPRAVRRRRNGRLHPEAVRRGGSSGGAGGGSQDKGATRGRRRGSQPGPFSVRGPRWSRLGQISEGLSSATRERSGGDW